MRRHESHRIAAKVDIRLFINSFCDSGQVASSPSFALPEPPDRSRNSYPLQNLKNLQLAMKAANGEAKRASRGFINNVFVATMPIPFHWNELMWSLYAESGSCEAGCCRWALSNA